MLFYESELIKHITLKGLSESTKKNYLRYLRILSDYYKSDPCTLTISQIKDYIYELISVKKYSPKTIQLIFFSIRFFFCNVLNYDHNDFKFYRVKRQFSLPRVLTTEEVGTLLSIFHVYDYKMITKLAYQTGLRVSEAVNVKIADINKELNTLTVRDCKGNKDRSIPLPKKLLEELREYWLTHKNGVLLFPQITTSRSDFDRKSTLKTIPVYQIQRAFKRIVEMSGINKKVSFHSLRHSYTTNLLNKGVNIFLIKEFMGHKTIKSTMIYLHLTSSTFDHSLSLISDLMKDL